MKEAESEEAERVIKLIERGSLGQERIIDLGETGNKEER